MKILYLFPFLLFACTSSTEQKALNVCECYAGVSHVYGLVPDSVDMTPSEYRNHIQNEFADSCNNLFSESLESLKTDAEKKEFFGAYRNCQGIAH